MKNMSIYYYVDLCNNIENYDPKYELFECLLLHSIWGKHYDDTFGMNTYCVLCVKSAASSYAEQHISFMCRGTRLLGTEEAHHPHDVLPTDRTLAQHLAATGARGHVAALEDHTLDGRVHADFAHVVAGQSVDIWVTCDA